MDELLTWFRGVLDEDEAARAPRLSQWTPEAHESDCPGDDEGCICGRPAFVLADIAAKRAIIDEHTATVGPACPTCSVYIGGNAVTSVAAPCRTVRLLAAAYARRPGYREEWRP